MYFTQGSGRLGAPERLPLGPELHTGLHCKDWELRRQADRQTGVQVQLLHSVAGRVFKPSTLQGAQHESPQEAAVGVSGYWDPCPCTRGLPCPASCSWCWNCHFTGPMSAVKSARLLGATRCLLKKWFYFNIEFCKCLYLSNQTRNFFLLCCLYSSVKF